MPRVSQERIFAACTCIIEGHSRHLSFILQVYILDAVAKMSITDAKDAESIVERVIPRLQHANSAVVLSAVKVRYSVPVRSYVRLIRAEWPILHQIQTNALESPHDGPVHMT